MKSIIFKSLAAISVSIPVFTFSMVSCANSETNENITILFTNDTHCTMKNNDTGLTWSKVAGFRNWLNTRGDDTILVDAGDFAQGSAYGTINQGKYFTKLLNACGYDLVTPGNHEFDYGMDRFNEMKNELYCPMISANFYHLDGGKIGQRVLPASKIIEAKGKKIGFVGVCTPQTLTSCNPKSFQDESGNLIYSFLEKDQSNYFAKIQEAIDELHSNGADVVIALTHSGVEDEKSEYYSSNSLISHTSGINAVLDGHSHTFQPAIKIKNKNNEDVFLTQTGTTFQSFGTMTINKSNDLSFDLVTSTNYIDQHVRRIEQDIEDDAQIILGQKIGDLSGFDLVIGDETTRWVRSRETNLADLCADAYAYTISGSKTDRSEWPISFINGGGVRKNIKRGKVTVGDVMNVSPFGTPLCKVEVTGQTILDMLEFSVRKTKKDDYGIDYEFGGFLHPCSVLKFDVNTSIPTPVVVDDAGNFVEFLPDQARRISNVNFNGVAIDVNKKYQIVSSTFTLLNGGDGYGKIFKDAKALPCPPTIDFDAITKYLKYLFNNNLINQYSNPLGYGRINITK